jgi:hypothetical protein
MQGFVARPVPIAVCSVSGVQEVVQLAGVSVRAVKGSMPSQAALTGIVICPLRLKH